MLANRMGSIPDQNDSAIGPSRQGFVNIERPTLYVRSLAARHINVLPNVRMQAFATYEIIRTILGSK